MPSAKEILIPEPMLACSELLNFEDLPNLIFPVYVSDKEDGIRCRLFAREGKTMAFSRSEKELPNVFIQAWAEDFGIPGLDGEIILPDKNFHQIQSAVMSEYVPVPHFQYKIFDMHSYAERPYLQRLQVAKRLLGRYTPPRVSMLEVKQCWEAEDVEREFNDAVRRGKEGLIVRSPHALYKHGRATWNEGSMYKMKKMKDAEAIITGFEEQLENLNPPLQDAHGKTKRTSHKANLKGKGTLGVIIADFNGIEIRIGSGWTAAEGFRIWTHRQSLKGEAVTFKYHDHGIKEKPRSPIFKGIRLEPTK